MSGEFDLILLEPLGPEEAICEMQPTANLYLVGPRALRFWLRTCVKPATRARARHSKNLE